MFAGTVILAALFFTVGGVFMEVTSYLPAELDRA